MKHLGLRPFVHVLSLESAPIAKLGLKSRVAKRWRRSQVSSKSFRVVPVSIPAASWGSGHGPYLIPGRIAKYPLSLKEEHEKTVYLFDS